MALEHAESWQREAPKFYTEAIRQNPQAADFVPPDFNKLMDCVRNMGGDGKAIPDEVFEALKEAERRRKDKRDREIMEQYERDIDASIWDRDGDEF